MHISDLELTYSDGPRYVTWPLPYNCPRPT